MLSIFYRKGLAASHCSSNLFHKIIFSITGLTIATDIICGFPTETEKDFEETLSLCDKYKFPSLFINQFFPRPGTPAALMPRIPAQDVKKRTKTLTDLFYSYEPYGHKIGELQEVLVTEISHDKKHYVGHNKFYEQVLLPMDKEYMGKLVKVKIVEAGKFSMIGRPLEDDVITPGISTPMKFGEISGVQTEKVARSKFPVALVVILISVLLRLIWQFL